MMHCDAINILCARSSDNKTASCRIARKDSSSLSKISPFPRAHKLAAYNIGLLRLGGRHQKDVRTRSETENFHGHGSDLVTRSMCIRSSNRGKNGTSGKEEQPRLCCESRIDCKKETGYRIKAIPAVQAILNSLQAHNFYPEANL